MSLPSVRNPPADPEKQLSPLDSKDASNSAQIESAKHDSESTFGVLDTELDIATHIVSVRDDPTLNPWTLRAFIVGLGLSAFGSVLGRSRAFLSSCYPALRCLNSGDLLLQTSMSLNCVLAAN